MLDFEYEQAPLSTELFLKFDHVPLADGRWHRLNAHARRYRVTGYLQCVLPCDTCLPEDMSASSPKSRRGATTQRRMRRGHHSPGGGPLPDVALQPDWVRVLNSANLCVRS